MFLFSRVDEAYTFLKKLWNLNLFLETQNNFFSGIPIRAATVHRGLRLCSANQPWLLPRSQISFVKSWNLFDARSGVRSSPTTRWRHTTTKHSWPGPAGPRQAHSNWLKNRSSLSSKWQLFVKKCARYVCTIPYIVLNGKYEF